MATILYVDDEEPIRRVVRAWLGRRGHQVFTASDIASACQVLRDESIDGVFVDLWLGEESGLELLDWIADHRPALGPRIALVTGDILPAARAGRAFTALQHPVLFKPFELDDLDAFVAAWAEPRKDAVA